MDISFFSKFYLNVFIILSGKILCSEVVILIYSTLKIPL